MSTAPPSEHILTVPLPRGVLWFGLPLSLGMALQVTFNLVDAYLVSRLEPDVAPAALGAIGICDQIAALGSIVSYGLSTATAAVVSRRHGRGDWLGVQRAAWQSTLAILVLGLIFGVLGLFGSRTVMVDVIGAQGQVATLGAEYLQVIVGGNVTIFLLLHLTTLQRALGSSKTPVVLLIASNLLNLLFAVLLVFGSGPVPFPFEPLREVAAILGIPRLGLLGAAWATVLARLLVLVPLVVVVSRRFGLFERASLTVFDADLLRQLWRLGWPSSTQLVLRVLSMLFIQALVARAFTTADDQTATIAIGVIFRLETMALFMALGWGSAAQTFVGQNLGAGQRRRAQASGWLASAYVLAMAVVLSALYTHFGFAIVRFFDPDPKVVTVALAYLELVAPSYLGLCVGVVLGSAMQGAGATRLTLRLDTVVLGGLLAPLALGVLWLELDLTALFVVIALSNVASAFVAAFVYRRGRFLDAVVS